MAMSNCLLFVIITILKNYIIYEVFTCLHFNIKSISDTKRHCNSPKIHDGEKLGGLLSSCLLKAAGTWQTSSITYCENVSCAAKGHFL